MNHWLRMNTLKGQFIVILLLSTIVPFVLLSSEAMYSIISILNNKIQKGVEGNLHQVTIKLDNTLENLYVNSQQFLMNGIIGQDLLNLLNSSDPYEQAALTKSISQNMNIFNFSNPLIGLTFYYIPSSDKVMFQNMNTRQFDLDQLPVLARSGNVVYNGPHLTLNKYNDSFVFSLYRKVNSIEDTVPSDVYFYMETNENNFQETLEPNQYGMSSFYVLIDRSGRVEYSGNPELLQAGDLYEPQKIRSYVRFTEQSKLGWQIALFVDKGDYNQEIRKWIVRAALTGGLSLGIGLLLALQLWRLIRHPLLQIRKGISSVIDNQANAVEISWTGLQEFDYIIEHFNRMRKRIAGLIEEVREEARNRQEVEVEKLMAQINPHFLYNTLNTAQWLAKMNGQHEIDRFLTLFTRLLKYNLAKGGILVTLKEEIHALKDYIELQRIRYDYEFRIDIDIDTRVEHVLLPRFLLQPIIENALYHGLDDKEGRISVSALPKGNQLAIEIRDNGAGMTAEKIESMLSGQSDGSGKAGMGIGLDYVAKTMRSHYGDNARLRIDSEIGRGTCVSLTIPIEQKEENNHD